MIKTLERAKLRYSAAAKDDLDSIAEYVLEGHRDIPTFFGDDEPA